MNRRPRILMVLDHSFPPDLRVENEAGTLIKAGYDVAILAIGEDVRAERDNLNGLIINRYTLSNNVRNKLRGLAGSIPVIQWVYGRKIREIFREWPFDALHAHDLYLFGTCLNAGRKLGVKVVGDMHENWVHALSQYKWSTHYPGKAFINLRRWDALETHWSREVDRLVVVIEEMKRRMVQKGLSADHVVVVPNTINRAHFGMPPGNSGEQYKQFDDSAPVKLIYTGGMDLHRGLASLIKAMPIIREANPGTTLTLVGDGAVRQDLEDLSSALGLDNAVVFEGWQPQESIPDYIQQADIGLIPHLKSVHTDNTIPHKLFHYMYYGLPVIASDCDPLKRIIEQAEVGVIYPSGDSERLADAVNQLVQDPDIRRGMGQRGVSAVAEDYNWETTAGALVDLYKSLFEAPA